jgi:hypothetical protein
MSPTTLASFADELSAILEKTASSMPLLMRGAFLGNQAGKVRDSRIKARRMENTVKALEARLGPPKLTLG